MMNGPAIGATTNDVGPEAKNSLRDEQQQQPTAQSISIRKIIIRIVNLWLWLRNFDP